MSEMERVKGRILSVVMDFIHDEDLTDYDSYSRKISNTYVKLLKSFGTDLEFSLFYDKCKRIKTNFFLLNTVKKRDFLSELFKKLVSEDLEALGLFENFDIARDFVSKYIERGFAVDKFKNDRKMLIEKMMTIEKPHEKIMTCFNEVLQNLAQSYQLDLHGVKEYSGIDICKKHKGITLGFQIKTKDDDISENLIRSEVSKAQEYGIDAFIIIYARKRTRKVDASIQAAFHYFKRLMDSHEIYCSIINPELLAELFREYSVSIQT
jgi:hypothetical protein